MHEVLIVGGGASGILVATQVARQATSRICVTIAEPASVLGAGLAYSTKDDGHLLNVPAGRMSAFPGEPTHFQEWAGCGAGDFISRRNYGRYLLETFLTAQGSNPNVSFRHERHVVDEVERVDGSFHVSSEQGPLGKFDSVILAIGHGDSQRPSLGSGLLDCPQYVNDPWRDPIPRVPGLMISIGTGLTFIDLALTHLRRDDTNSVIGISRTGELPKAHLPIRSAPLAVPDSARLSPIALRTYIEGSADWRAAQDGVRHELPEIWHQWSEDQKGEFWNSHLRWWNVHRHRMAPAIADELQELMQQGRLRILPAASVKLAPAKDGIALRVDGSETLQASVAINTTGYLSAESSPLIHSMNHKGLVAMGPLNMGIKTSYPSFELVGEDGARIPRLFGVGPILLGERFETTAIPEIREQAENSVKEMLAALV